MIESIQIYINLKTYLKIKLAVLNIWFNKYDISSELVQSTRYFHDFGLFVICANVRV